jgi:hypothetical protein
MFGVSFHNFFALLRYREVTISVHIGSSSPNPPDWQLQIPPVFASDVSRLPDRFKKPNNRRHHSGRNHRSLPDPLGILNLSFYSPTGSQDWLVSSIPNLVSGAEVGDYSSSMVQYPPWLMFAFAS